jgi:hypothetical protein
LDNFVIDCEQIGSSVAPFVVALTFEASGGACRVLCFVVAFVRM